MGLFARTGGNAVALVIAGIVIGAIFGVIFGWVGYRATGGHRDFTSRTQVVAATYDVLCAPKQADEARNLLAKLALHTGSL
jgi:hypothetical protein